ncbi:2,3-diaminopropionate biosynthesis protein SbnB [Chromobacterium subtsugae]|uniref:2,3-diaminopropionate biosynthesis protein SbnB n=1 Tax=Chromobacterium subtsugae TaxID=251747 RepID=UPI0006417397|nr:2,3-diaminopropionate biosynthesis protein SbnB [Chromobacterium subtsugae]
MHSSAPNFSVITGDFIHGALAQAKTEVIDIIRQAYLLHHQRKTVNPDSYFLRFADKPEARIIALPAAIRDADSALEVSGIKWIASYPGNVDANLQRASAVVLLNDYRTGYPFACLEASQISSARTAASAVLAAQQLWPHGRRAGSLAIIGGGVIAGSILSFFDAAGWQFDDVRAYDINDAHLAAFTRNMGASLRYPIRAASRDEALQADIVVLATTAGTPWIPAGHAFAPSQLILNVSLRDLAPETIAGANNVLDDVEHCMKANTSPHLAEQRYGHRGFIDGTLAQVMQGEIRLDPAKPTIFSPFGLGVLDLCLAMFLYRKSETEGASHPVPGFFADTQRWNG